MTIKLFFALLFFFIISSDVYAQSVIIKPKKVTYTRRNPSSDYKKTFVVTRPQVKASTPALSRKIEAAISYEKNNNFKLSEEMGEYQWLEEAGYEITYNKNGLLDITLFCEGSAAYPSSISREIVIDLKTGIRVRPQDIFTNLAGMAALARKAQAAEIKKSLAEYKKDPDAADFDGQEYFKEAKFTVKNLDNFSVSDEGVTFIYNYAFPHAALALQPDGRFFYSWAELKPFIKRGGLLQKLIR